jgi:ATP synthase protein I
MRKPQKTERPATGGTTPLTSDLEARIARAEAKRHAETTGRASSADTMTGWGKGLRLGSEFVAAILVGLGIGWLLDSWLHTTPWLMLVMLMFGFAAGVLNVVRSAAEMNKAATPPTAAPGAPNDADE